MAASVPTPLKAAMRLPSGARFYCCALQVNPYAYLVRHGVQTQYADETSYNAAIVDACLATGVEIIGITDHYRISSATRLLEAAKTAGITVFPGFEAVTKDGVHFICLLDPGSAMTLIQAKISDCGIHDESEPSPIGKYDASEFLEECRNWRAACIAAHATSGGGLLTTLSGQARVNAWKHPELLACSLPGPVPTTPAPLARIIENVDAAHKRPRRIAVVNSQDISDPADLRKPGAVTWIKMSEPTAEGLRQSFLDPESRVRLTSDQVPEEHAVFVAMAWEGGFLDGCSPHFNENLNVLIGGRGAGKSSVVESLRYVLHQEPIAEDARKTHDGIVKQVLKNGTKISLLVESHRPDKRQYLIERTVPNPPHVRDLDGNVLPLAPRDVLPRVEVLGAHSDESGFDRNTHSGPA